ncbi:CehA/McbA family metallohydrolase [Myxococcota bacterium]|nr:CehA/McbA family metallohydrolase [Myxococcota bacterium]
MSKPIQNAGGRSQSHLRLWAVLGAAALMLGCAEDRAEPQSRPQPEVTTRKPNARPERPGPPTARWEMVDMLRAGRDHPPHPSDGGGRAWLEPEDGQIPSARVGEPGSFHIVYEVGPLGIAENGAIYLQVSPFWNWSTPQTEDPRRPGYTEVSTLAEGVELEARTLDKQLMGLFPKGRGLRPGERIDIRYGVGPAGASVDRYAESRSRFWIGVDGDGDGTRKVLDDSPGVDVLPAPPAQLLITIPSTAKLGDRIPVNVAILDALGNAGMAVVGDVVFDTSASGLTLPERVTLGPDSRGRARVFATITGDGVHEVSAKGPGGLEGVSNPLAVNEGPRILWGDLHGHSALSDGTGTPEEYFEYARDVAALDVVSLTDHDHWGILPLDEHPELYEQIGEATHAFHDPGSFVTLLGYEWTSWIYGHRHVLYFDEEGPLLSSLSETYETPQQLWDALRGHQALTFAHHSAGGPIPTDWSIPPDPEFEPVTEIVSTHGSSEALDSPGVIYSPVAGNFVRDVLDQGIQLGFVGSGDSHNGHPGLTHLDSPSGGLAAILSEDLTREGVLTALRNRRVYATNGPRIILRTALGPHPMGATVELEPGEKQTHDLFVRVIAPETLERIDLIRSGAVVDSIGLEDRRSVSLQTTLEELGAGDYVYVRAVQRDGGAAWSSPIFFIDKPTDEPAPGGDPPKA